MKRAHDIEAPLASIEGLTELIGGEALRKLSNELGGRRVYVPARPGEHHFLTVIVGQAAADQLADAFGGAQLCVPLNRARQAEILELDARKWTRAAIAKKMDLSERRIYQVLEEARRAGPKTEPKGTLL